MTSGLLRGIAIVIALAGLIDPAVSSTRRARPEVSLIASPALADAAIVERVADALVPRFTVVRGPSFGAASVVAVGDVLPAAEARQAGAAFAVLPEPRTPVVNITAVDAPADRATPPAGERIQALQEEVASLREQIGELEGHIGELQAQFAEFRKQFE